MTKIAFFIAIVLCVAGTNAGFCNTVNGFVPPNGLSTRKNADRKLGNLDFSRLPFGSAVSSKEILIRTGLRKTDLDLRGGASDQNNVPNIEDAPPSKLKKIVLPTILSALTIFLALNRRAIAAYNFKEELASGLDALAGLGTPGLVMYIFAFMFWEITVGVTTPVETAAGMAFGLKKGIMANAIGKTCGAVIAFLLGRYVLKDLVEKKLEGNELMELVQDSIIKNPVRVALIWRFSFLPEQIKNFGLAVLPLKTWQFISAVLMHGEYRYVKALTTIDGRRSRRRTL